MAFAPLLVLSTLGFGADINDNGGEANAERPSHTHEGTPPRAGGRLGDPVPDLTQQQMADFVTGLGVFEKVETASSGLGPIYNHLSCASCHSAPVPGGSSAALVTRFGRNEGGHFDPLIELGGPVLQSQAIDPGVLEKIPDEATVIAQRQSTALFGAGLIEAIPDDAIQAQAQRKKPDGILGRAALVQEPASGQMRVGRFGWKAQKATIAAAVAEEYWNEMGITNPSFPTENAPNGDVEKLAPFDHVADPEAGVAATSGQSDLECVTDFIRYLAAPAPPRVTADVQTGFGIFNRLGCAECHVPTLFTGQNKIRALDRRAVVLFSDLLLHDMGSLNDGIAQADALPNEMKTPPLWGLGASAPYLHDGRAPTIAAAIRSHDGEGAAARERFEKLNISQQRQLLEFLKGL